MNRRTYLTTLAASAAAAVAGCTGSEGGEGDGTATLPPTVQTAMEEAEETETATATATEPTAAPLDWRTYGGDGANTRHVPEQEFPTGEYEIAWTHDGPEEATRTLLSDSRVVAAGGRLFAQSNRDRSGSYLVALRPDGETLWERTDANIGGIVCTEGALAGITFDRDVLIMDPETGERTGLVTGVDAQWDTSVNQLTEGGRFVLVTDSEEHELTVVDLDAGEQVVGRPLDGLAYAGETVTVDGSIVLIGEAPTESSWEDGPMKVQVRDASSGDVETEFERTWVADEDMGRVVRATSAGDGVYATTYRDGSLGEQTPVGLIAFGLDGELRWRAPEIGVESSFYPPMTDGERVYLITENAVRAFGRDDGAVEWTYETTKRFSAGAIVTDDRLLVPDHSTDGGVRVHRVDTATGEADRVELYGGDAYDATLAKDKVRIRPATEGLYVRGDALHHVVPTETDG